MGCKYWETAATEGLIDYDQMVQYPFGHGLSYTTFLQALFNDDPGDVLEKLLTRLKQNKDTKKYNIPATIQALAAEPSLREPHYCGGTGGDGSGGQ